MRTASRSLTHLSRLGRFVRPLPALLALAAAAAAASSHLHPARILALPHASYGAVESSEESSTALAAAAVFQASILNGGQLTTTGTLTESVDGGITYARGPADRLQVKLSSGGTVELRIGRFEGDPSEGLEAFLKGSHALDFHIRSAGRPGNPDLACHVVTTRQGPQRRTALKGQVTLDGAPLTVDLVSERRELFDINPGLGHHYHESLSGTVTGPGLSIRTSEAYEYRLVNTVQQMKRTIDTTWTDKEATFQLQGGRIHRVFRSGRPVEPDFWRAEGTLTRNGAVVGGLKLDQNGPAWTISLVSGGQATVLEQHVR